MTSVNKQLKQSIIWRGFYFITLLLINIVLSRFLKADGAGVVFYLSNLFSIGVLVFSANLDGGVTYFASSKTIENEKLASLAIIWTLIITLVSFFTLPLYFNTYDFDLKNNSADLTQFGIYYIVGILLTNFFTALFYSVGNFVIPNVILGVTNLLLIGLIYFGVNTNASASEIMHDYFQFLVFQGILLLLAFYITYKILPVINLPNWTDFKQLLKYSSISLIGNFLFFFVYRLDYWFVKAWCIHIGELGNYIQASKLSQMLLIIPQILASSIFPQIASGYNKDEIVNTIARLCRIFSVVFLVLFFVILGIGKFLFPLIFGSSFSTMYLPMLILLPGVFCLCCSTLLSAYFSGRKQNQINLYAASLALLVMLVLTFTLKSSYSIIVAASISSIAYFIETLFCFIHFTKKETINWRTLFYYSFDDWLWIKRIFIK